MGFNNEFAKVSVSTISRMLESFERKILSINSPRESFDISAFLGYGIFQCNQDWRSDYLKPRGRI
jgi:hypothetical protein